MKFKKKYKWKLHKIENGSSFKKPLYLNDLFENKKKKLIEEKKKLKKNKNGSSFKKPLELNDLFRN